MHLVSVKVAQKYQLAEGICGIEFVDARGLALPSFLAGAHIDVHIRGDVVRQYSLCNSPSERHRYVIGVLREPASRGGSAAIHDRINAGDILNIGAPRNHFELVPAARYMLFAGGIGVTPILSMAEQISQSGGEFEMHFCAKNAARMPFVSELLGSRFADRVHFYLSDGPGQQKLDAGRVLASPSPDTHLYVCGPAGYINWIIDTARQMGWLEANIHREFFSVTPTDTSHDVRFQVRIASTGQVVTIPADFSVVAALMGAGVDIPTSCSEGVCGSCLTGVLEGKIDHRDAFLTDEEKAANNQFAPCVSRACGGLLVLDL